MARGGRCSCTVRRLLQSVAGRQLNSEARETYDTCYPAQRPTNGLDCGCVPRHGQKTIFDWALAVAKYAGEPQEDVEPMTGIEPAYSAWEADVLPLNYIGNPGQAGENEG